MPPTRLRRYQLAPYAAILDAAHAHDADQIVVIMARQLGKNELSAHAEAALMATSAARPGARGVKAAPTQDPQAIRSLRRLHGRLSSAGFGHGLLSASNDTVTLGEASWWFGSGEPEANVVGDTASLLLEFDEAQDFDIDVHDRRYSPMAASTAAARIYYGTPFSDFDLLAVAEEQALARQARDGKQRVFRIDWQRGADELPAYGLFVDAEMRRLGHSAATPHPAILTEYELQRRPGAGRFLNAAQLTLLQGEHPRLERPQSESHSTYVAGVDFAGADLSGSGDADLTVLTIARSRYPGRGRRDDPVAEVVTQYHWQGVDHDQLRVQLIHTLRTWNVAFACCDATGIGEPHASFLANQLGQHRVEALKFTSSSKSTLAYDALAAINTRRLTLWAPDGAPDTNDLWRQLRLARADARPGSRINVHVHPSDGHDDRLMSLLLAQRASQRGKPAARTASYAR